MDDRANLVICNVLDGQSVDRNGFPYNAGEHFEADQSEAEKLAAAGKVEILEPARPVVADQPYCMDCGAETDHEHPETKGVGTNRRVAN